jgi:hypothetical protein
MEKEIYLQYYPLDKEIHIWLTNGDETKTVSQYDDGIGFNKEKVMMLEHGQFSELYNALAEVNIQEFLEKIEDDSEGEDGAVFEIAFGGLSDKVHLELNVTKDNMETRNVKTICEVVKRILEISGIDKKEYENDFIGESDERE